MIVGNARFYYDMLPEDRKGKKKRTIERAIKKREGRKVAEVQIKKKEELKTNIEIIGYRNYPVFKSLRCGECFLLPSVSDSSLYMKIEPIYIDGSCVGNAVKLNNGEVITVCDLVDIIRTKINIKAEIER